MAKNRGIYKRGKYYWIRYAGADGRIVRESTGSEKYTDAETKLFDRKQAIRRGEHPELALRSRHTFGELAGEYLRWAARQRGAMQKASVVKALVETFGPYPLYQLADTRLIEQYQTDLLSRGLKPATINRHLATLKHAFTKAVEWGMAGEDALKRVRRVKLLEENNRRLRFLSREECGELLAACEPHLRPIVVTALNTGMRKGEILGLRWDQVDLRHGFILLDRTKNGTRREIPLNATLRATLRGLVRRLDVPYVFYDLASGKRYQNVHRSFQTACRRAGIRDFRFHDLRHTFASHLVMAGVDLTTVKELLGHKTVSMTLRYAHLAPAHRTRAVAMLDGALSGPSVQKLHIREGVESGTGV